MTKILKYKGYTGTLEIDIDDNCLCGVIEFIVDVVSYSAPTPNKLEKAFKDAVDDYIDTCKELGRDAQKPFSGTFNIRVGTDLHKRAVIQSKIVGVSLNEIVKTALNGYLDNTNEKIVHHIHKVESNMPEALVFNSENQIISTKSGAENWTQDKIAFQKQH